MLNMAKGGLNSAANWLDWKPEIGPDTLAPLGMAGAGTPLGMWRGVGRAVERAPKEWAPEFVGPHRGDDPWSRNPASTPPKQMTAMEQMIARAEETSAQRSAEWPTQAAVRVSGRNYAGANHGDAILRAEDAHGPRVYETAKDGFLTNQGRFVSREEAGRMLDDRNSTQHYRGAWFGEDKPLYVEDFGAYDPKTGRSSLNADNSRASLPGTIVNQSTQQPQGSGMPDPSTADILALLQKMQAGGAFGAPSLPPPRPFRDPALDLDTNSMPMLAPLSYRGPELRAPAPRPAEYTAPIAEMTGPPIPGVGMAAKGLSAAAGTLARHPKTALGALGLAGAVMSPAEGGQGSDLPPDAASDVALEKMQGRQDDIRTRMDKAADEMRAYTPKPRAKGQSDPDEKSDPKFFTAKKAYDALKQQHDDLTTQIGGVLTERKTRQQQQLEGNARLQEIEKEVGPIQQKFREYGPLAGYAFGLTLPAVGGHMLARGFSNKAASAATRADALVNPPAKDWARRAERVNQFWDEGGSKEIPFPTASGQSPPFRSNPRAGQASELYKPGYGREAAANTIPMAGYGAEFAITAPRAEQSREEVEKARQEMSSNPTEANIKRYQSARDDHAFWEMMANFGRVAIPAHAVPAAAPALMGARARPNVSAAGGERLAVEEYLNRRGGGVAPPQAPMSPLPMAPQPLTPTLPTSANPTGPQLSPPPPAGLSRTMSSGASNEPLTAPLSLSPKPVGGTHPDHDWDANLRRWRHNGRFISGPPPE